MPTDDDDDDYDDWIGDDGEMGGLSLYCCCFGCVVERIIGFVGAELVVEVKLRWPTRPARISSF